MNFGEKDIKRFAIILLVVLLGVLVFILVRPILMSIIAGLLLAYVFNPVYNKISKTIKNKNLASGVVLIIAALLVLIPLWYVIPLMSQQIFESFKYFQSLDVSALITSVFPNASDQFVLQMTTALDSFIAKITSSSLNFLLDFFLELPTFLLHIAIISFVFFFALRDKETLKEFVSGLSPLSKAREQEFVKQFRDITDSLVYGQVIIGIVQGIIAGLGFLLFGIPGAFLLTSLAIVFSIVPTIGPAIIWIPVALYLFTNSTTLVVILFILYNILIVSTVDNILRIYIVSKSAKISTAIVLIGMIGGLFIFGILGLILGPLILAYFLTFLRAYKEKKWQSLFAEDK